ncbi:hypothetical protein HAHE_38860 [Haloferula helveola]|uniref:TPM domain-containing protein n=1 Tax=Haloferula helveola TaxID=490095 RepID=A0ABM7RPJ5_9BACT|nr:hypothetical protein HAHE_38860 [Haloferula helveola]
MRYGWLIGAFCFFNWSVIAQEEPPDPPTEEEAEDFHHEIHVPEEFLDDYFATRPSTFLRDPQNLLDPRERKERAQFLEYHSDDSLIDFHLFLFAGDQMIPEDVRVEELAERFFGEGKPSVLVLYFLGAPERTILQLSPQVADDVPKAEQKRLLAQAVRAAEEHPIATEQLEAFCVQTAIRIFWIERAAGLTDEPPVVEPSESERLKEPPPTRGAQLKAWFGSWWSEWGVAASTVLGGILTAWIARWIIKRRARYRFPEFAIEPRLGGDRGAGIGAVIQFGSTTQSPSTQKGKPDDVLGGI